MLRFHCPECGVETEVTPQYGDEIVSVYCLRHTGGAEAHRRPVYMTRVATRVTAAEPEPVLA
jgi:hypothetical protein